ncbi:MAG: hypothetical protein ACP5G2_03695 [Candidatus Bipolaricaulaceae bacterium]
MTREVRGAVWIGIREAAVLAVPVGAALLALGPRWAGGLVWGVAAVTAGRLAGWWSWQLLRDEGRPAVGAGLSALARQLLMGGLAVAGIAAGLAPLAVAAGLCLPPLCLWAALLLGMREHPC